MFLDQIVYHSSGMFASNLLIVANKKIKCIFSNTTSLKLTKQEHVIFRIECLL